MFKVIISFKEEALDQNGRSLLYHLRRQMIADMNFYPNHDGTTYLTIYERKKKNPKNWLSLDVHMANPETPHQFLHLDYSFSVDMNERDMVMRIQWDGEEAMNAIGERLRDHCVKTNHVPWVNPKWIDGMEIGRLYPESRDGSRIALFNAASNYPFPFSRIRVLPRIEEIPFHQTLFYKPDVEKFLAEVQELERMLAS